MSQHDKPRDFRSQMHSAAAELGKAGELANLSHHLEEKKLNYLAKLAKHGLSEAAQILWCRQELSLAKPGVAKDLTHEEVVRLNQELDNLQ